MGRHGVVPPAAEPIRYSSAKSAASNSMKNRIRGQNMSANPQMWQPSSHRGVIFPDPAFRCQSLNPAIWNLYPYYFLILRKAQTLVFPKVAAFGYHGLPWP